MSSYRIVDLRGVIPGNPKASQGPHAKTDGVVIHYNGPPTGVPAGRVTPRRLFANDAAYHMRPGVFEAKAQNGIQYHFGVWGDTVYILRNPLAILYHCGAWPQNKTATAINVPIGGGERANKRTIRTLRDFVNDQLDKQGRSRSFLAGHQELKATACPGTLMDDFVRPYRRFALNLAPTGDSSGSPADPPAPSGVPQSPPSGTVFRVIAGAFGERSNAQTRANQIKAKGFGEPWIYKHGTVHRVQVASFSDPKAADQLVMKLKAAGFEAYALAEKAES